MPKATDASKDKPNLEGVSAAQRERLCHIDFKLRFMGSVNRNSLVEKFGIKGAAATRDFNLYQDLAPKNIEYNTKAKTYIQRESFAPLFEFSSEQVLTALSYGFGDENADDIQSLISTEAPTQLNLPDTNILASIAQAIYRNEALTIHYRSLSSGESLRVIVPHTLVNNGLRWHVRAFDRLRNRFGDFVLNRIEKVEPAETQDINEQETIGSDLQWKHRVELQLIPHPKLSHPKTIEKEYSMKDGVFQVKARMAMVGYILRRWNVDCSKGHSLIGDEYHLALKNFKALEGVDNLSIAPGFKN